MSGAESFFLAYVARYTMAKVPAERLLINKSLSSIIVSSVVHMLGARLSSLLPNNAA